MSANKYFIADLPELLEKKFACGEHSTSSTDILKS